MQSNIDMFNQWINESDNIVFFGGAGVSTESGIPDFRSPDGLYHMKYAYPPEIILSHQFFLNHTKEFYNFHRDKMVYKDVEPNITHRKLAELEHMGKLKAIITQNIDGLHQKAGSHHVIELHGSLYRNYCMKCKKKYELSYLMEKEGVPYCQCGGIIKPDVVLYEEALDEKVLKDAIESIKQAKVFIVGGTSLSVYPAAGLIRYYKGNQMVLINQSMTDYDQDANLLLKMGLGDVFSRINVK